MGGWGTSTAIGTGANLWSVGSSGGAPVSGASGSSGIGIVGVLGAGLGPGKGRGSGGHGEPTEEEIYGILSALTSFGHIRTGQGGGAAAGGGPAEDGQISRPRPGALEKSTTKRGAASGRTHPTH